MHPALEHRITALKTDIDAVKNGAVLSLSEIEKRANTLAADILASSEKKHLLPYLDQLLKSLDELVKTLEDTKRKKGA